MKFGDVLVLVLVVCLVIVFSPILIPLIAFGYLQDKVDQFRFKRYLKAHDGAKYFAYTSRQTSQKYVEHNILPELPKDIEIMYLGEKGRVNLGDDSKFHDRIVWAMKAVPGGFPYISKVANGNLVTESINNRLYSAITRGAASEQIVVRIKKFFQ